MAIYAKVVKGYRVKGAKYVKGKTIARYRSGSKYAIVKEDDVGYSLIAGDSASGNESVTKFTTMENIKAFAKWWIEKGW